MLERYYPGLTQGGWRDLDFEPFREGVTVHWLHRGTSEEPSSAILKYEPHAGVPAHRHDGVETILVLEGTQSDEQGDYPAGSLVLNDIGTTHSVWTDGGCVVFIQWNRPVVFV
ncbi:MAG TPA: cupin domain-containing protein [Devosiaceae bacterium]|jgi:anti-sigma factor ChrR (cupin superfamily)|nr:cupin domain-containing protein [Devosiaceae bacterium]